MVLARCLSSATSQKQKGSETPTLKEALKKFYMRVHPDLYDSDEKARKLNTQSLGELTNITDTLATERASSSDNVPTTLAFYIKAKFSPQSSSIEEDLVKISTSVSSHNGKPQSPRYMQSLHRSLSNLFVQSGLEPDFIWGDDFLPTGDEEDFIPRGYEYDEDTLYGYLERMSRLARLRAERSKILMQKLQLLMIALHAKGFKTLFDPSDNSLQDDLRQYECLNELRRMLGLPPPDPESGMELWTEESDSNEDSEFRGSLNEKLFIFTSLQKDCRVDGHGRIVLPTRMAAEDWKDALERENLRAESKIKADLSKASIQKQKSVAEQLGLDHLFADPELHSDEAYITFLESLENECDKIKDFIKADPSRSSIPIRIHPKTRKPRFSLHKSMGVLSLPVDCSPDWFLQIIRSRGEEAQHLHRKYLNNNEEADNLRLEVSRSLRLSGLQKGSLIDDMKMKDCCKRLVFVPPNDRQVFEGLQLIVCSDYEVLDNGRIRVPWNWR